MKNLNFDRELGHIFWLVDVRKGFYFMLCASEFDKLRFLCSGMCARPFLGLVVYADVQFSILGDAMENLNFDR